jgi:hypothetical protein
LKRLLSAVAAICISSIAAYAGDLTSEEQDYIALTLTSMAATNLCDGYSLVPGSMTKIGDRFGVSDRIRVAAAAAVQMTTGLDYDRTLLIPEVARFVNHYSDALMAAVADSPAAKRKYCHDFIPVLLQRGTIEKTK